MSEEENSAFVKLANRFEGIIMTRLVPMDNPGPVFKWLFKIPIFFYEIGLPLFGSFIIMLTTNSRKTGKPSYTPLEYHREEDSGYFIIIAGLGRHTDWYRNVLANPKIHMQAGWRKFYTHVENISDEQAAEWLTHVVQVNSSSLKMVAVDR
jgi:deazaflavin-dependent oxidoreductase (nitroreductase family)